MLGITLGDRDVTTAESDRYLLAVDGASPRVTSGVAATSVQGRPLRYAIVGRPERVTSTGLAAVRASAAKLMDPRTSDREAAQIAASDPAILWIAANVHGGEESGTDASLRVLYELADRSDCAAQRILDQAVVVILPIQNPDGREADSRRNANGFDMNRDWFARTQPETDGKVELLRRYPGVLFIDAHEFGGTNDYFFPPNADPVYHDIADPAVDWINDIYGAAMQHEFDERGIPYFNYDTYDLFYAGYGDTVPATGFGAAGMTFEKANGDPAPQRVFEQYITQWTSLSAAAINKARILREWHGEWVEAVRQGEAGELEPNRTYEPGVPVSQPVPDRKVRHYFLRADDPDKAREVQGLVRRLQRMDVEVRRLSAPLAVPDFRAYGRAPAATTLPTGTYWIPMAQRQKHWIQAMLNESTYTPVGYAYDIVGWSSPLLFNVTGGSSGAVLSPRSTVAGAQAEPAPPALPAKRPSIAVYSMSPQFVRGIESSGWLHWLLDRWGVQVRDVSATDIADGWPQGRRRAARARRLRAQGPERPVGSRTATRTSGRRAATTCAPSCRTAAATSAGSTAACSPPRWGSPARSTATAATRASPRRAASSACASTTAARWRPASGRSRGCSTTRATCSRRAPAPASRCAIRTPARRTSSSPGRPTAPRRSAAVPRRRTSASAAAAWWRSASTRTSARSPTGRRSCCATPSSAPTRPPPRVAAARRRPRAGRSGPRAG